jgi:hypothetical protein
MVGNNDAYSAFTWLQKQCLRLVAAAKFQTSDGLVFYHPVVHGNAYPWFYLRDFTYMYESAPEFFPQSEVRPVLAMLLGKIRRDGWAPERITADGKAIYRCHGKGDVIDSAPFCVQLFNAYAVATGDFDLVYANLDAFWKMLAVLPHEKETGLIWIDPENPHTGYGFTDQVAKTGRELFCSLLVLQALTTVSQWAATCRRPDLREQSDQWRTAIRSNLSLLWAEREGMFYAASEDCRQLDIWGSVYACRLGVLPSAQYEAIVQWLATNHNRFEYMGHLRHLPEPQFWCRIIPPFEASLHPGEFQNGPYWSTPSGWYAEILESKTSGAGLRLLCDLVHAFQEIGIWECIGHHGYRRVADNLSSALLPYGAFKRCLGAKKQTANQQIQPIAGKPDSG